MHDENFDDQEVELLDDNVQPDNTDLVGGYMGITLSPPSFSLSLSLSLYIYIYIYISLSLSDTIINIFIKYEF